MKKTTHLYESYMDYGIGKQLIRPVSITMKDARIGYLKTDRKVWIEGWDKEYSLCELVDFDTLYTFAVVPYPWIGSIIKDFYSHNFVHSIEQLSIPMKHGRYGQDTKNVLTDVCIYRDGAFELRTWKRFLKELE